MAIITISRQYGSGGDEIANRVCRIMGYRIFDKSMIQRGAVETGLTRQEILDFCEENYKMQGFLDRLFNRTRQAAQAWSWADEGFRSTEIVSLGEENGLTLIQHAIRGAYQLGDMVILGRGGQVILQEHSEVLHVRIEAPLTDRIQRIRAQLKQAGPAPEGKGDLRKAAQTLIESRDASSKDYLRRFYGVDWSDPLLYHAVINTGRLGIDLAAETIAELAMRLQSPPSSVRKSVQRNSSPAS